VLSETDAGTDDLRFITPLKLKSNLRGLTGTVSTVDGAVTLIDVIETLTDDSAHLIEVSVSAEQDANTKGGVWIKTLYVTKRGGTVVVQNETSTYSADDTPNLNAGSVTFAVSGGDVNINVSGAGGANYKWDSTYKIRQLTTN